MRRVALLAAALGVAAAAGPLSAVTKYVAIGDSITIGSSYPVASCGGPCPIVFDCTPGCAYSDSQAVRDECGHAGRLEDWLGPGFEVRNRGIGGESTFAAIGRFETEMDNECPGSPGDCAAVLLMHGTNDMGGSPETVRDNIAMMIAEAKSRNIDVLLMTIIRDYNPSASAWSTYNALLVALAADEDLELVETHNSLCLDQNCRNFNYFLQGALPCNDPNPTLSTAHLDPNGYDVLTGLIQAEFPGSVPLAPAPTAPSGDVSGGQPDFVWSEAATARWYELEVDGASTWWEAAAHCSAGTCTVYPGVPLAKGSHAWRVRGRNLRGLGSWSATTNFTVWQVPGQPTPTDPSGLFIDPMPTSAPFGWEPYTWSEDPEATDYDLVVYQGGTPVVMESFTSSICGGTCAASPGEGLMAGNYTWTVQARNPAAAGTVSAALAFEIYSEPPGAPTPTAPAGDHYEPFAPLYRWLPEAYATEYDLEVRDAGDNLDASAANLPASTVCSGGLCSYQGGTLTDPDDYTLRVLGRNPAGTGMPSSPGLDFTVLACADMSIQDLASFQASPVTTTESVSHCGPITAASAAAYTIEATGDLTVYTRDGFRAYDGLTVFGNLAVRSP